MEREHEGKWKKKLVEVVVDDHATWCVETTKITARSPLESFILFKI